MRLWPFGSHRAAPIEIYSESNGVIAERGTPADIACGFCMVPKGYGCINVLGKLYGSLLTYADGRIDFHLTRKKDWEYEKLRASLDSESNHSLIEGNSSLSHDT